MAFEQPGRSCRTQHALFALNKPYVHLLIMQYKNLFALSSLLSLATAAPKGFLSKRIDQDEITWGPLIGLGPTVDGVEIVGVVATIYPGNMPKTQAGGLYNWIGINNETETGDLVQGIVGSYSHGESECKGAKADSLWYEISTIQSRAKY